jgi:uncharacterized protein YjbI with pentapeptide repeats
MKALLLLLICSLLLIGVPAVSAEQNEFDELMSYIREYKQCDHCNFTGANFKNYDFNGVMLDYSVFDNAMMDGVKMPRCHIDSGSFNNASMVDANLEEAYIDRGSFINAKLRNARLVKADLPKIKFYGTDLRGANLSFAILRNTDFTGADLSGTKFIGANFDGATNLNEAVSMKGADFSKADLSRARPWSDTSKIVSGANEKRATEVYCIDLINRGAIISRLTKCSR